ncbi:MAG: 1-acyl-sn-glycerol-3-phosphate acyltransferase [archaeon]
MGYVDKFRRRKKPDSRILDAAYSVSLSYDILKECVSEVLGLQELEIKEPYIDEGTLVEWFRHIEGTLESKFFNAYFRPELINGKNIPAEGAMVVANHSGMFAWDGLSIGYTIWKETNRAFLGVGHNLFDRSNFLKTIGAIGGDSDLVVKLLKEDRLVFAFPGGVKETIKPYWERYKVQRVGGFAPGNYGYLLVALEAKKPVVPLGVVGAEETHIQFGNVKPYLDDIIKKAYSRLPSAVQGKVKRYKDIWDATKGCPLMLNVIPFPSKISVLVGEPLYFYESQDKISVPKFRSLRHKKDLSRKEKRELEYLKRILDNMNERVLSEVQYLIDTGRNFRKDY